MAEKQSKTSGELRELVTAELSKHPECAGEVVILGKAGNWDTAMTGEKPISRECRQRLKAITEQLRNKYELD